MIAAMPAALMACMSSGSIWGDTKYRSVTLRISMENALLCRDGAVQSCPEERRHGHAGDHGGEEDIEPRSAIGQRRDRRPRAEPDQTPAHAKHDRPDEKLSTLKFKNLCKLLKS